MRGPCDTVHAVDGSVLFESSFGCIGREAWLVLCCLFGSEGVHARASLVVM